jgi:hypothetical protein
MKFITILLILLSGSLLTSIITFSILLKKSNHNLIMCNTELKSFKNNNKTSLNNYLIYNSMDISNEYNLLDEFGEKIMVITKDVNVCSNICDSLYNCNGFSKFNNFCYLKKKCNETDIYYSNKVNFYKQY